MNKQLSLSLICTFVFTVALTQPTYAVDGCSSNSFKVATHINLEAGLFGMAVADFNSDGHLDLIASPNNGSSEVLLLLGRGGMERFGPPTSVPAGGRPRQLAVGDFNGDGKPDFVASLDIFGHPSGRFSVLLNDGTGKFGAPNIINLQGHPLQPLLGDLNNDGKLDIVAGLFTGSNDGKVAIFLGNGAGGFSAAANSPLTTLSVNASEVLIGDFNENGKRDLALPGQSFGTVSIMLGDGAGGFAAGVSTSTGTTSSILTAGDFNNDGHLDLLNGNRMLLGTGSGSFAAPIIVPIPENNHNGLAGDVNHDGHLDLVAGGTSGSTIMLGNGTGNLVRAKSYASLAAVLGDFNENGKIDLAASQRSGIGILEGDGTGAFNDALSYHTSLTSPHSIVAADFNNDGKQDFAVAGPPFGSFPNGAGVEVVLGDGTGGFTRKSFSTFGLFLSLSEITTADFNSDGKLDLAVTRPAEGRVYLLLNDGTGGFPANETSAPHIFAGFGASTVKAGDFNNDTKADLIVTTPNTNNFSVLIGDGSGAFTVIPGGPLQGFSNVFDDLDIGDFNGDGKSDIAVVTSGAKMINVLKGDGTGHFSNYATALTPEISVSVVVKDFNGDGKPDIAATSSVDQGFITSWVTVLINDGAQGFNPGTNYPTDGGGMIAVGDFNSDNHPDLAMTSGSTFIGANLDGIAVLTNKGNGQFNAAVSVAAGSQSSHLAVGDFNNDGKADVVFSQPANQSVVVLLNNFTTALPCLSLNDVTVTENDTGTIDATFTVTLSAASAQTVRVNYFVLPVFLLTTTATKGADFEDVSGTVNFAPGETTKTINVPIKGDLIDEFDQFFLVALTTPLNALISDGKGLGKILDNDAPATMSVNDVSLAEGTQDQATVTFTLSLNGPSEKPISVQLAHEAGTATPDVDYFHVPLAVVELEPGTITKTFSNNIIADNTFEPNETFFLNLSNVTNATITDAQGQATIVNDDPQPTIAIASSSRLEGAQGTSGNASFEVKLSNPSFQTITVSFATADGTATAGNDYAATSGTVTFNSGDTTKLIAIEVKGDNTDEINETLLVNLSNPTNATIATAQGVGTILDDDGPSMSIDSVSVTEGNTGFVNAVFTVTLSAPSVQDILVSCSTFGGTASSNGDFQRLLNLPLFFPAGTTSQTVTVRVFGDFIIENDEQFTVTLQNPSNATIAAGQGTGTGTIINDDSNGKLQFSSATYSVNEDAGNIVITVNRVEGATSNVTVDFATSNGTAVAGSDYTATSGTLSFVQGETSKSFSIPITFDNIVEGDETINLTLSNLGGTPFPSNATLGNPITAVVTIKPPSLLLILEKLALAPTQVAAVDALWFLRDPFPVISPVNLEAFNPGLDQNTRVIVFVANLQLATGEAASSVLVKLVDSNGQTHDVAAEDVRVVPGFNFAQVKFRLPDNLPPGVCNIRIRVREQETNLGTFRIRI